MASHQDESNPFAAPETGMGTADDQLTDVHAIRYADFATRFAAAFVDGIIVNILGFVIGIANGIVLASMNQTDLIQPISFVLGTLLGWLYSALQESSAAQATLGKKLLGIKVVNLEGARVSFAQATGRHFGKIVSAIILLIGFLIQPFTEKRQALHDIMSGCLVIKD